MARTTQSASGSNRKWKLLNGADPALKPGDYVVNSAGGSFAVVPQNKKGEWEFSDSNNTTTTNQITIGDATQTFTDNAGVQQSGPYIFSKDGGHFKLVNIAGGSDFLVVSELGTSLPSAWIPNGSWNATTDTLSNAAGGMNTAANRVQGSQVFAYFIDTTGTFDLGTGDGPTLYEQGGQIFWWGPNDPQYIPPGKTGYLEDILANRPAAGPTNIGLTFYSTDTDQVFKSNGAGWIPYESIRFFSSFALANAATIYPNQIFVIGEDANYAGTFMYKGSLAAGVPFATNDADVQQINTDDVINYDNVDVNANTTELLTLINGNANLHQHYYRLTLGAELTLDINTIAQNAGFDGHIFIENFSSTQASTIKFVSPKWKNNLNEDHPDVVIQPNGKVMFKYSAFAGNVPVYLQQVGSGGEGLRGEPVADNTELTALTAREYERRLVKGTDSEYVFKLTADLTPAEDADVANLADDATTGKWIFQPQLVAEERQVLAANQPYINTDPGYAGSQSEFQYTPVNITLNSSGRHSIEINPFQATSNLEAGTKVGGRFELRDSTGTTVVASLNLVNYNVDVTRTHHNYGTQVLIPNVPAGDYQLWFFGAAGSGSGNRASLQGVVRYIIRYEGVKTVVDPAAITITNNPGTAGQTLQSNGDGTASWA